MQLPIDGRKAPYRGKYLDETAVIAPWFEFGTAPDGLVDVSDPSGDIFTGLSRGDAQRIIEARDAFLATVHDVLAMK